MDSEITTVGIGLDGTCMLMCEEGWREAMVGTMYFRNHLSQMEYAQFRQKNYPIGSGVTEAACKTLIKQRLCCSGIRWKEKIGSIILSLRALILTSTRLEQFWDKLNQYSFPVAT
jgi:hypothetical protein